MNPNTDLRAGLPQRLQEPLLALIIKENLLPAAATG